MNKKVGIIIGTRPEAIKLIPIYIALKNSNTFETTLISTGQHKEMLTQIFSIFNIEATIELEVMTNNQSLSSLTAKLTDALNQVYEEKKFDLIIVQGDTTTAFTAGLVAFYHKIKVAHVEAGLRTYDNYSPFPEEVNRKMISCFANYHFAPTEKASNALNKENANNVFTVGNTVIDLSLIHI